MTAPLRPSARTVWLRASAIALACGLAILCVGALAWSSQSAMLAPPLGATAYLAFRAPTAIACAPRNVLVGHGIALTAGWIALQACGADTLAPALSGHFGFAHACAAALAMVLTVVVMIGVGIEHPPACATTVVVGLGLLKHPGQLVALEFGAFVVTVLAFGLQCVRGRPAAVWAPRLPGLPTVPAGSEPTRVRPLESAGPSGS